VPWPVSLKKGINVERRKVVVGGDREKLKNRIDITHNFQV
jgi:hypothetical protein